MKIGVVTRVEIPELLKRDVNRRSFLTTCTVAAGAVSIVPEEIFAMSHDIRGSNGVCVLDGPGVHHMRSGLARISCAFTRIARLSAEALSDFRLLILCGNKPSVDEKQARAIQHFLEAGGAVLAVGGGARCMIDNGLFDAEGYYPTGTTVHQSSFDGYHRLTFGYPGAEPEAGWPRGVPMLVRATEGPLMELGPNATSILSYGWPYSAAAFQRIGKGIALLIGPDPQGGDVYHEVDKPRLTTGEELKTDRLLVNAIAFLQDQTCNIIPNSGFEENTDLPPEKSNWTVVTKENAEKVWCAEGAPQGAVYLKLICSGAESPAKLQPYCPLVVERGAEYVFRCQYRSSADWEVVFTPLRGNPRRLKAGKPVAVSVASSGDWNRAKAAFAVPEEISYIELDLRISGKGELSLDDLAMRRKPERRGTGS